MRSPFIPPRIFLRFFRWFCRQDLIDHIEGDLLEVYKGRVIEQGKWKADLKFIKDVMLLVRPEIIRPVPVPRNVNTYAMFRNYFIVGWRNILRSKGFSFINIGGLALGMTVAILIGLWVYDEITYDNVHPHHHRIAQVMQNQFYNGEKNTQSAVPGVMAEGIRNSYGADFTYAVQASWNYNHTLVYKDKIFMHPGSYAEPDVTRLFGLEMIQGSPDALKDINAILLSASLAKAYFGDEDPIGKVFRMDNRTDVHVAGVYNDLPQNASMREMKFIVSWELYGDHNPWSKNNKNPWGSNFSQTFVMIAEHTDMEEVSKKIMGIRADNMGKNMQGSTPEVFLHPMDKWHLHSEFKNGVIVGGQISNVWLFGIIGIFVLLLACINFMNLSTARSEKRAKEVGIRKVVGSARLQLVAQFFSESVLIASLAFTFSILIVALVLPAFNSIAEKQIEFPWTSYMFWALGAGFTFATGLFAGLYPAVFLSSFQSVKVLKGTFIAGRLASLPRKVLVVVQFSISISLIIGTAVVYKQIRHAQSRSLGYNQDGLLSVGVNEERIKHIDVIRNELKTRDLIVELTTCGSPITEMWSSNSGFEWEGKDPGQEAAFPTIAITYEYGKTVGWEIKEGRDFSRAFASDTAGFILNESAVRFMGLKDPIGQPLRWGGTPSPIVGVVKDLLVQSPYTAVQPSIYYMDPKGANMCILRLNPALPAQEAYEKVAAVFKEYDPMSPFNATFVNEDYARKFANETRIGKLAARFAGLAIVISCLGLFGLASFIAERRTKELGVRKVLGASVSSLWRLVAKDFIFLVTIACGIGTFVAWYELSTWLEGFEYRTTMPWWIFAASSASALVITLITVSFQAIRAALVNPVRSLRSE